MKNKINFITGETYTLSELFSGERKIIIPDLQRDYCWGDEIHTDEKKELVSGFVTNLIEQWNQLRNNPQKENLSLGLIYGYEIPENHIQLCDGQQRITTLFLLLGMLNRQSGCNAFRPRLISDFEYLQDDKEPYLQYAIRESSLYFLSDLVCHFFIVKEQDQERASDVEDIKNCTWFFNEYNYDPSICSMLKALARINEILKDKDAQWCCDFGEFLTTRLTFLYYDMENRKNGEETFVVINTTGEPLSTTQNLKPLVAHAPINEGYQRIDQNNEMQLLPTDWEEIETWFWSHRRGENDTADAGFNEFLRWVTMLYSDKENIKPILATGRYAFPYKTIPFEKVYNYWLNVQFLFDKWEYKQFLDKYLSPSDSSKSNGYQGISQIDCLVLLPLIAYCNQWGVSDPQEKNLFRLYKFLQNISRIDNVSKNVNDLVFDAIQIAHNCQDLIDLTGNQEIESIISKTILTEEEIRKLTILKENPDRRNAIEELFWRAQDDDKQPSHKIWSGQIFPLINWATKDNGCFDPDAFGKYLTKFDEVFVGQYYSITDLVRRALLKKKLHEYPRIFRGYTNFSFGWEWSDWQELINDNQTKFKEFFDDLLAGQTLEDMIKPSETNDETKEWAEFVHKDYLLAYCEKKNIQKDDKQGWLLIKGERATKYISVLTMHLSKYLETEQWPENWAIIEDYNCNRAVLENKIDDIVFDIWFYNHLWRCEFFSRYNHTEESLKPFIDIDSNWKFNSDTHRYEGTIDFQSENLYEYPNVRDALMKIIKKIDKTISKP